MRSHPSLTHGINLQGYGPKRSNGIHLSAVLRHIALKWGVLDKQYAHTSSLSELISSTNPVAAGRVGSIVKAALGFAWESWIAQQVDRLQYQPGEVVWDGIIGTPDGLELAGGKVIIHEFKLTWKTSATPITEEKLWLWQIMALCYMLGMELGEPVTDAVIHPVYLAGNYRDQRDPVYLPMVLEFEQRELEINWRMIMDNKYNVMPEVW